MKLHSIDFFASPGMVQVILTAVAVHCVMVRMALQTQMIQTGEQCVFHS